LARTTTTVALLYLLVGTVLLGVIGSFALYRPRPLGATERAFGAVMAVLNGGLLLALVLRTLRSDAFAAGRGETLQTSVLSRLLIEDVGYLLLAALLLGGIAAVIGIVATRRDDDREMALLASVGSPTIAIPAEPHDAEQPTAPTQPAPRPPVVYPTTPPTPQPIYAIAPLIDWPATPPPGIQLAPSAVGTLPKPDASPAVASAPDASHVSSPLPTRPQMPLRVPPPIVYPIADLVAAQTAAVAHAANAPSDAASLPAPSLASAQSDRPIGPPPGTMHPAVSCGRDRALSDAPPPVVRELPVITQDAPVVQNDRTTVPEAIPTETLPGTDGGPMHTAIPAPPTTPPPTPDTMMATTAIPAMSPTLPPPLPRNVPPIAMDRPTPDAGAPPRAGYARVAVARQASDRPDEPPAHPPPSAPPEPLRPPLPTGPRVYPCPTCGYPVRDHARYCPNCGSRQKR
ncbi:MAG: zinc-ribbon domain-containing protein, partial [Chloroflexota bacterium]|nr:zinc-ribbon domain-containing protein [Chloroflexota bacterium]